MSDLKGTVRPQCAFTLYWRSGLFRSTAEAVSDGTGSGIKSIAPAGFAVPLQFRLDQNYPNSFNPAMAIGCQVSKSSDVSLVVHNVLGERVTTLI